MTTIAITWNQRFSSTVRGARLARHLLLIQLESWRFPYKGAVSDRVALVVAELVSNAVRHGRLPGRDFELRVTELERVIRVEVSDARRERRPSVRTETGGEGGYGMCLVGALTSAWGVSDRTIGKTVWAEISKREEE
ncbi:ATP-binding protein [Streptomyces sp. NPDC056405]|uniref:ATP-binding protein n=1 Tax=Streptomyces sp. NPDC056405 TaxID=3345811 RepID=UPI0035DE2366